MNRLLILIVMLVGCSLASAQVKTCQEGGQYCQNHWDCCSNTCLSFLYKCSRIMSTDIRPLQSPSASAVIVNRGSFEEDPPLASSPEFQHEIISYDSLLEMLFSPPKYQPAAVGRELNSIQSRIGEAADEEKPKIEEEVISTTTASSTTVGPECLEIGLKCYFNEECCTKRCHGYLHQCVT